MMRISTTDLRLSCSRISCCCFRRWHYCCFGTSFHEIINYMPDAVINLWQHDAVNIQSGKVDFNLLLLITLYSCFPEPDKLPSC